MNRTIDSLRLGRIEVVAPPAAEPVTAIDLSDWLRLPSGNGEEAILASLATAARLHAENASQRTFAAATLRLDLAEFPCGGQSLQLRRGPVRTLDAIAYVDADGAEATLDVAEDVTIVREGLDAYVYPRSGRWPATRPTADGGGNVRATYTAGFESVPETVLQAIKLLAAHWHENREATSPLTVKDVPLGFDHLLAPYTDWRI